MRIFRTFNAASEAFLRESERHEPPATRGGRTVTHKLTDGGHVLHVGTLARVEGEGAMHIEFRDGGSPTSSCSIFEPPRFYEAFLRGRSLHRAAGHHRAHLRHLPGRLPDERLLGDRGRLRRRPSRRRSG